MHIKTTFPLYTPLTHWGRVTHICIGKLTIIGSHNGLLPGRRQAIIWTNAGILLIEPLGTNFSEILIRIKIFSFKKMRLKMLSAKWCPFCLGLNVLMLILHEKISGQNCFIHWNEEHASIQYREKTRYCRTPSLFWGEFRKNGNISDLLQHYILKPMITFPRGNQQFWNTCLIKKNLKNSFLSSAINMWRM